MDTFVNEKDFTLLKKDRCTFAVLDRILRGTCEWLLSDHENLILCHSEARFPVWIWSPDGASEEVKDAAWQLISSCRPLADGFRFNLKYDLAAHFIQKAAAIGIDAAVTTNLFAYDCPQPQAPRIAADGEPYRCTAEDVEEIAAILRQFYIAIGDDPPTHAYCLGKAEAYVAESAFFFWKNRAGRTVACCSYKVSDGLASIGSVYTLPEARRKHYAQSLVYRVTKLVADAGYTPMLYTDADYPASNACYAAIGYVPRGKLCTISARR